ncbi:MAG: ribosome-binding factor [Gammaproteobacteria bacterium]|jgi:ribosome-binding factor A|nr:ribosome-binding factor [Gammaproteobacteria bacterium]
MAEARTRRIESEIQRVLSELIAREVKDPRVGNVTITAVSLAADMGVARVFFTPFASKNPGEQVREGLTRAGGFLRGEIGRRLRLRHAPRLEFLIDDTADKAAHLTGLINRAVESDRASAAASESAANDDSPGAQHADSDPDAEKP